MVGTPDPKTWGVRTVVVGEGVDTVITRRGSGLRGRVNSSGQGLGQGFGQGLGERPRRRLRDRPRRGSGLGLGLGLG